MDDLMNSADKIKHFLVTRDPNERKTTVREFGSDYDAAQDAYQDAEQQARGTNLDVVLLSAESLETIKRTHSSYFDEGPNVIGAAIGGAVGGAFGALASGWPKRTHNGRGTSMAVIRNELRQNEQGEPEVWANLGDILDWLDTLASPGSHPAGAKAALEIKQMLLEQFSNATVVQGG
jgi:hypothetical protein